MKPSIPTLAGLIKPRDIQIEDKFDKILKAYLDGKTQHLPADLQHCLERWSMVNDMLREGHLVQKGTLKYNAPYRYNDLVKFIVQQFNVSIRTAYDDIKSAKRFFAIRETREEDDFAKGLMIERLEAREAEAWAMGDHTTAVACNKLIITMRQWDKPPEEEAIRASEFQIPHTVIVDDPSELGFDKIENVEDAVQRVLSKRKKSKIDSIFAEAEVAEMMNLDQTDDTDNEKDLAE